MLHASLQPIGSRRSPSLGVGGVTLLMLVTLVLTTSPALGRGRDAGTPTPTGSESYSERSVPTQRAEQRLGGRRELANRQMRPVGTGFILSLARAVPAPDAAIEPRSVAAVSVASTPSMLVRLMVLNLPPPQR